MRMMRTTKEWCLFFFCFLAMTSMVWTQNAPSNTSGGIGSFALETWMLSSNDDPSDKIPVVVPSTVLAGLIDAGQYVQPFYSLNLQTIPISRFLVPWVYETTFQTPSYNPSTQFLSTWIVIQGLSYKGQLSVNNHLVIDRNQLIGTVRVFHLDISQFVVEGPNTVRIELDRPVNSYVN